MEQLSAERQDRRERQYQQKQAARAEVFDWIEAMVFALVTVIIIFTFLFRIVIVSGTSMTNTLQDGDRLILNSILYTPKAGDIVVVAKDSFRDGEPIIKRVIATEGETVDINRETGRVSVNGKELSENYIKETIDPDHMGDWEYPLTVPDGCIFVMGDNRNGSTDSRFKSVGFIELNEIKGHAVLRLFPLRSFGLLK